MTYTINNKTNDILVWDPRMIMKGYYAVNDILDSPQSTKKYDLWLIGTVYVTRDQ